MRAMKEANPTDEFTYLKVHSYRTLKRRVYYEKARQHLYQALFTITKVGCEKYIKLALEQVRGNRNLWRATTAS